MLRSGLAAIYAVAKLYDVEIDLHDAFLAPENLYHASKISLHNLTQHRARMRQKSIFGRLLAYGATASHSFALLVLQITQTQLFEIKAVMIHKRSIFGIHHRVNEIGRYIVNRHIVAFKINLTPIFFILLKEPLNHKRRDRRIDKTIKQHGEYRQQP